MRTIEELMNALAEGKLTPDELEKLENRLMEKPKLKKELDIYKKAWEFVDYQVFLERKKQLKALASKGPVPLVNKEGLFSEKKTLLTTSGKRWAWRTVLIAASLALFFIIYFVITQIPSEQPSIQELAEKAMNEEPSQNSLLSLHTTGTSKNRSVREGSHLAKTNQKLGELLFQRDYSALIEFILMARQDSLSPYFQRPEVDLQLAIAYYQTREYEKSLKALNNIENPVQYDIEDRVLWNRGRVALKLGNKEEGKRAFCLLISKDYSFQRNNAEILLKANEMSCEE